MAESVYTIGHSTHTLSYFFSLLERHGITALCDVRSMPYSRMNSQFNREDLEADILARGIAYRYLGRELGARSDDPSCYSDGKVRYERLAKTPIFQNGLQRVARGVNEGFRVALMCAEKEPLECHRTILVARHLVALGFSIEHIHADGRLERHDSAMERLAGMLDMPLDVHHMFLSREDRLADVYSRQEARIAYEAEPAVHRAAG